MPRAPGPQGPRAPAGPSTEVRPGHEQKRQRHLSLRLSSLDALVPRLRFAASRPQLVNWELENAAGKETENKHLDEARRFDGFECFVY